MSPFGCAMPTHELQSPVPDADFASSERFLGTAETARLLGVGPTTIQRLVDDGTLLAWKTRGGHRRISRDSVEALLGKRVEECLKLTILISDSHAEAREAFVAEIAAWGYPLDIRVSEEGVDALVQVERLRPDLWIVDPEFVEIDGWTAVLQIARYPEMTATGIVVCSAIKAEETFKSRALAQGVVVYRKPVPLPQIQGVIADSLARKARLRKHP